MVLVGDAERSQVQVLHPPLEHEQLLAVGPLPLCLGEVREPVLGLVQRTLVHVEPPLAKLRVDRRAHPVHLALLHLEHEVPVHVVGQLAVLNDNGHSDSVSDFVPLIDNINKCTLLKTSLPFINIIDRGFPESPRQKWSFKWVRLRNRFLRFQCSILWRPPTRPT